MNIELHMIQNFPPSCLNRDDTNTPKTALFGGFRRARVSSQCLKRAIRIHMKDALELPVGTRTRRLAKEIASKKTGSKQPDEQAIKVAAFGLKTAGFKLDDDGLRTSVGLYWTPGEIKIMTDAVIDEWAMLEEALAAAPVTTEEKPVRGGRAKKDKSSAVESDVLKSAMKMLQSTVDAVDIALFGRMVAEFTEMEVDAACQVAHAISTHVCEPEVDFYTAVDDLQPEAEPGAGMMGLVGFDSPCLYRYSLINLRQLTRNLSGDVETARRAVSGFVRASIEAVPSARQNSTAPQVRPDYVLVTVGADLPLSLVNAFSRPVNPTTAGHDLVEMSVRHLSDYLKLVSEAYPQENPGRSYCVSTVKNAAPAGAGRGNIREMGEWLAGELAGTL